MSDSYDVIPEDGVYTDKRDNSFQFRKGHLLAKGQIAADDLKKVGPIELITPEGKAALEVKADEAPENKMAPAPANKAPEPPKAPEKQ